MVLTVTRLEVADGSLWRAGYKKLKVLMESGLELADGTNGMQA